MSLQAACPHSETPGGDHLPTEAARAESFREDGSEARTGVLLVNHGSRSPNWRQMLFDLHAEVAPGLLAIPGIAQVRTAFMEYTEPSIATQLRAFDESGVETVLVVPMLLTISDHSFDDIPTICGLSADPGRIAQLEREKIEVYAARAELLATLERLLHRVLPMLPEDQHEAGQHLLSEVARRTPTALVHGDLSGDHVLMADDAISGVIDWSDARVGDPALDLAWALYGAPEPFAEAVATTYGATDDELTRALAWWRLGPWYDVLWGQGPGGPAYLEAGIRSIGERLGVT